MAKRRFRIEAGRYGGETVIGEVNREFVDFFIDKDESDLIEAVQGFEFEDEDMIGNSPKIKEDFYGWYECDNFEHQNHAYADSTWVYTEVPSDGSDDFAYDDEIEFEPYQLYGREAYHSDEEPEVTEWQTQEDVDQYVPVLAFHSSEKGSFAAWFVETDGEDFDPKKLAFSTVEMNLCELVENVWYDKVELEPNYDFNETTGKAYYASVGYFSPKGHDTPDKYSEETLEEFWECYDEEFED